MTSMIVQTGVDNKVDVWHIDTTQGLANAQVWPSTPVPLAWVDGTLETIPGLTRCLTKAVTGRADGSTNVDLTTQDYYVVTYKGAAAANVPPSLVPITQLGNLDSLYGGQIWQLLGVLGKWGSRVVQLSGVATVLPLPYLDTALLSIDPTTHQPIWELPNPGDLLIGSLSPIPSHLPVWERLPIPNSGSGQVVTYEGLGVVGWVAGVPPPLAKGDILRANVDGSGNLFWERYPITAGNQGDVLMNDSAHSGLPIWAPSYLAVSSYTTGTPYAASNTATTKAFTLGTVPGGWYLPAPGGANASAFGTYNDAAWGIAVLSADDPRYTPPIPGARIVADVFAGGPNSSMLLRQHFTPSAPINIATLQFYGDNVVNGVWVNGEYVSSQPAVLAPGTTVPVTTVVLRSGLLVPGIDNVVALQATNDSMDPWGGAVFFIAVH